MRAEEEWERFTCSGKVTDYLEFKDKETAQKAGGRAGEQYYAGVYCRDRDGNQDDACR
ncbi:hypothetical protein V1224_09985 [Lachnospiraceae bacterium JLR.KK008]